jgi:hypothetical protein
MKQEKGDAGKALRDTRNRGLKKEQEQLSDPDHHTPREDDGGNPDRSAAKGDKAGPASKDQLTNPPQVEGPREKSNDMV